MIRFTIKLVVLGIVGAVGFGAYHLWNMDCEQRRETLRTIGRTIGQAHAVVNRINGTETSENCCPKDQAAR
jgi:hypothetical protein